MPLLFGSARRTFSRQPIPDTYPIPSNILMTKASHGNDGVWKAWKAIKPAFHPSHTPWKSLRGFPHYHGYDGDYHVFEDR
jgi:hypothetical protein